MVVSSCEVSVRVAPGEVIQLASTAARVKQRDERGEREGAHAAQLRGRLRRRHHDVEGALEAPTASSSSGTTTTAAFEEDRRRRRRRRDWQNAGFFLRRSGDVEVVEQRKRVTRSGTRAATGERGERRHSRTMRPREPRRSGG